MNINNNLEYFNCVTKFLIKIYKKIGQIQEALSATNENFISIYENINKTNTLELYFQTFNNLQIVDKSLFMKKYDGTIEYIINCVKNNSSIDFDYISSFYSDEHKYTEKINFSFVNDEIKNLKLISNFTKDMLTKYSNDNIVIFVTMLISSVLFNYLNFNNKININFLESVIFMNDAFLKTVSENSEDFFISFLAIIDTQLELSILKYKKTQILFIDVEKIINENFTIQSSKILFFIFMHPTFTVESFFAFLNITKGQAIRYLNELIALNVLTTNCKQRNRTYYLCKYYNLLKEVHNMQKK